MPIHIALTFGRHQITKHMTDQRGSQQTIIAGFATVQEQDQHHAIADHTNTPTPQHGGECAGAHQRAHHNNQRPQNRAIMRNRMPLRTFACEQRT